MKNNYLILLLTFCALFSCGETITTSKPSSTSTTSTRPMATSVDYDKVETNINDFNFEKVDGGYAVVRYFYKNKSTTRVVIPEKYLEENVVEIKEGAFVNASGVRRIVIPKTIKSISHSAFESCSSIIEIEVSKENINYSSYQGALYNKSQDTFLYCPEGVESIILPDDVKHLGDNAFFRSNAKTITLNEGLETIGNACFSRARELKELVMPDSVISIGESLFAYSQKIKNVKLSNSLKVLPKLTFSLCSSILEISVPNSVTTVEEQAITDNDYLQKVTFGNKVETIAEWAVIRNTFLKEVVIPSSLKHIAANAFSSNDHLTTITLNEGLETIGEGAFALNPSLPSLNIPSTVKTIGEGFVANNKKLVDINVSDSNQYFKDEDGVLLSKDGTRLLSYPSNKEGYSYNVPSTVTSIDREAFSCCIRLSYKEEEENIEGKLTLPTSIKSIGPCAFSYSNTITEIYYEGTKEQFNAINITYLINGESYTAFTLSSVGKIICKDGNLTAKK